MSILTLTLSLIYLAALFLYSALPFLRSQKLTAVNGQDLAETNLIDNREQLLQMLRDLKLDYELNKISINEFETQNQILREELALVLQKIGIN